MELPSWLAVVIIIVSIPSLAFTLYKLVTLIQEFLEGQKRKRKPSEQDIEKVVPVAAPRRPSQNVISISTIEGKEREYARRQSQPYKAPPITSRISTSSLPTTKQTSLEAEPVPKMSACCLSEERLLGLGPMPFDISIVEEERQKEVEKLQRAPEEPPVAKILSISRGSLPSSSQGTTPGATPQPTRQPT